MTADKDFKHESLQDKESIAEYLAALRDGFSKGLLTFRKGNEEINLTPSGLIQVDIKARKKANKSSLSVICTWKEKPDKPADKSDHLEILSGTA